MPNADSRSYTVREIAAILAAQEMPVGMDAPEELVSKRLRQVRHWTACDYLRPIGKKHSGTGVARRYGPDEVRKAALLRELTHFGLSITQFGEEFGGDLEARANQKEWRQAIDGKELIFFQIITPPGGSADESGWLLNLVPAEKSLLRLLDPKFVASEKRKRRKASKKPHVHELPIPNFVSGLTISLTQLFANLDL